MFTKPFFFVKDHYKGRFHRKQVGIQKKINTKLRKFKRFVLYLVVDSYYNYDILSL